MGAAELGLKDRPQTVLALFACASRPARRRHNRPLRIMLSPCYNCQQLLYTLSSSVKKPRLARLLN